MYPTIYASRLLNLLIVSLFLFFLPTLSNTQLQAQTAYYTANGSDYYMNCRWEKLTSKCCSETKYVRFYVNGSTAKTVNSAANSGNVNLAIGPGYNHHYQWAWGSAGKDNSVCVFGCSWDANRSTGYRARTANIKSPTSVTASNDKVGSIKVSWSKASNIPNANLDWKIYKDSRTNLVATVTNGASRSWTDINVGPGETHTYYVATYTPSWGVHESYAVGTTGSTIPREVTADDGVGETVVVRWESLAELGQQIDVYRDDQKLERIDVSETQFQDDDTDLIPGFQYNYSLQPVRGGTPRVLPQLSDTGFRRANGRFSGEVKAPSGSPVANVIVCAERLDDVEQGPSGIKYCDTTDASGFFDIRKVYYHREAQFKVVPSKGNHGFSPASISRFLDQSVFQYNNLLFIDTTGFTIQGKIVQQENGTDCGLAGVEILVDGIFKGDKTDADGNFNLSVEETGDYTIKPRLGDHTFAPSQQNIFVSDDKTGINFNDEARQTLSGYVRAGCQIFLGEAQLRVRSQDGCIDKIITTKNNEGFYEAELPARAYTVEVVEIDLDPSHGLDRQDVLAYFNPQDVDLTHEDQQQSFTYRRQPDIEIVSVSLPTCGYGTKIVEQHGTYEMTIKVTESFGSQSCPVDTGYVLISDEVGDKKNSTDTLYISNGEAIYTMIPQSVNIIAPYTKVFQATVFVGQESNSLAENFIVTGVRPRDQSFTTVSPSIPFMILRDPPGDESYSYLEENTTTETALSFFGEASGSIRAWAEVKAGTKFQAGLGLSTETEIWGSINGSMEVGARIAGQKEHVMSITNSSYFATSDNPDVNGQDGDVYVGAALNLIYALSDIIEFDRDACEIVSSVDLIMGNDGFETTFMYTENHIRDVLIPDLDRIRIYYEGVGSDSAAIYANQINVWEQSMERNAELKQDATFKENRSFSAGAPYESSLTESSTKSLSLEFSAWLEASIAIEAGLEIGGNGVSGGVETRLRAELGAAKTVTSSSSRTVGYFLGDDDPGDFFSVNILNDEVYATPVFDLVSGRSSCPHESGTQPREGVQLQADRYVLNDLHPSVPGVFQLSLGNISQSEETRDYKLAFIQSSNPNGAKVTIGGSQAQQPIDYTIPFGQAATATVTIEKGPLAHDYPNLKFALVSGCDDDQIIDVISLSVYFENSCSPVSLFQPGNDWVVNELSNNQLSIKIRDYDVMALDKVVLEYADVITGIWSEAFEIPNDELETGQNGTTKLWNVSSIQDGEYLLRLRLDCGGGYTYSDQAKGRIDRVAPALYATPEPADGYYSQGDRISVKFDEMIECLTVNDQKVIVRNTATNETFTTQLGCSEDRIIIAPDIDFTQQAGAVFEVLVDEVEDLYGNTMDDFISWRFQIDGSGNNTPTDTDDDGILDEDDNCPLAANPDQSDLDGDGEGDICDDDLDGDGVLNADDNCPQFANSDQADSDNDGEGDVCEASADGDGDGIPNDQDNCPTSANPDQSDMDNDGIGDTCDEDIDGDGVANADDNCATTPNPDQMDTNTDGIGDACQGTVSTQELPEEVQQLSLYPNPSNGIAYLSLEIKSATDLQVKIVDLHGRLLISRSFGRLLAGNYQLNLLDGAIELPTGMYQVVVQTEMDRVSRPLVVQ